MAFFVISCFFTFRFSPSSCFATLFWTSHAGNGSFRVPPAVLHSVNLHYWSPASYQLPKDRSDTSELCRYDSSALKWCRPTTKRTEHLFFFKATLLSLASTLWLVQTFALGRTAETHHFLLNIVPGRNFCSLHLIENVKAAPKTSQNIGLKLQNNTLIIPKTFDIYCRSGDIMLASFVLHASVVFFMLMFHLWSDNSVK